MTELTRLQEIDEITKGFYTSLVEKAEVKKLPEHLFVSNFLPFFMGEKSPLEYKDFYSTWISIVGTPSSELDVIDKDNNVLYRVPAILDTGIVNIKKDLVGIEFSQIVLLSKLYSNMTPKKGESVLESGLSNKLQELQSKSPKYEEYKNRWIQIFSRYKKPDKDTTTVKDSSSKISNLDNDEIEY